MVSTLKHGLMCVWEVYAESHQCIALCTVYAEAPFFPFLVTFYFIVSADSE